MQARLLSFLKLALIWVPIVIAVLVIGVRLFALTPVAHNMVESRLEALDVSGQSIAVDGLSGDLLGEIRIDALRITDSDGTWLDASELSARWSPLALISGTLELDHIRAREINVERRPELAQREAPQQESSGSFIDRYQIGEVTIIRLALAEGVAGPQQAYAIEGAADIGAASGEARLSLRPEDANGDRADIDLAWSPDRLLSGTAEIVGQPGGLIAGLIGAPEGEGVTASLAARQTGEGWELDGEGAVGGETVLDLAARQSDDGVRLQGRIDPAPLDQLASLTERLGGPADVSLDASLDEQGPAALTLDAPNARLVANGTLSRGADRIALTGLTATLETSSAAALTGVGDLRFDRIELDGDLVREGDDISFDGTTLVLAPGFGERGAQEIRTQGLSRWTGEVVETDLDLVAMGLTGMGDALQPYLGARVTGIVDARIEPSPLLLTAREITLTSTAAQLTASGTYDAGGAVDLTGDLRLADAPGPITRLRVSGTANGRVDGELRASLSGTGALDPEDGDLAALIGEEAEFTADISRGEDGVVDIRAARLTSSEMTAEARGTASPDALDMTYTLSHQPFDYSGVSLGALDLDGTVSGAPDAPVITTNLETDRIEASGQTVSNADLFARVEMGEPNRIAANSTARFREEPARLDVTGTYGDTGWTLAELQLDAANLEIRVQGQGSDFTLENSTLDATVNGSPAGLGALDANIALKSGNLDADARLTGLEVGPLQAGNLALNVNGAWPRYEAEAELTGQSEIAGILQDVAVNQSLSINLDDQQAQTEFDARLGEMQLVSDGPIRLDYSEGLNAEGQLVGLGGAIGFCARQNEEIAEASLDLDGIDLATIGPLVPRPFLRGDLSGRARYSASEEDVSGQAELSIADLGRGDPDSPEAEIDLAATLDGQRLETNVNARQSGGGLDLAIFLALPVETTPASFALALSDRAPAELEISGGGEIAPLWALVAPSNVRVEGQLQADLSARAPLTELRPTGTVSLRNALVEDGLTGLYLTNINAEAHLDRERISVQRLSAEGSGGGTLSGSGAYGFDGDGSVSLDLASISAFNREDVSAVLSGTLSVSRGEGGTDVEGDIEVERAEIDVNQLPGAGYTTLDVTFRNGGEEDEEENTPPSPRDRVSLDVAVNANNQIYVVGPGIDTEWGVDLDISGTASEPLLRGAATLVRGEASLLSRSFRLREGTIRFLGPINETEIDIRARRESEGVTVTIALVGSPTDPDLQLSSDPTLPEDEILSRVLFGRSPSEISPLQAAQLAGAAASLAGGGGGGLDVLGSLQDATGLDSLDLGIGEGGGAVLGAGKYLADDVYLNVETGLSGIPGVSVEWTPLDNVEVDASVNDQTGQRIAIQWKHDFDHLPFTGRGEEDEDAGPVP